MGADATWAPDATTRTFADPLKAMWHAYIDRDPYHALNGVANDVSASMLRRCCPAAPPRIHRTNRPETVLEAHRPKAASSFLCPTTASQSSTCTANLLPGYSASLGALVAALIRAV